MAPAEQARILTRTDRRPDRQAVRRTAKNRRKVN